MKNIRVLQIIHYFNNFKIWLSFWNDDLIWSKYIHRYILLFDAVLPEMASSSLEKMMVFFEKYTSDWIIFFTHHRNKFQYNKCFSFRTLPRSIGPSLFSKKISNYRNAIMFWKKEFFWKMHAWHNNYFPNSMEKYA